MRLEGLRFLASQHRLPDPLRTRVGGGRREEGRGQGRPGLGQGELSSAVVEKDGNQGRNWMEPVAPLLLPLTNNVVSTNPRQAHCDLVQNETT